MGFFFPNRWLSLTMTMSTGFMNLTTEGSSHPLVFFQRRQDSLTQRQRESWGFISKMTRHQLTFFRERLGEFSPDTDRVLRLKKTPPPEKGCIQLRPEKTRQKEAKVETAKKRFLQIG
jgi:hypothetical protein